MDLELLLFPENITNIVTITVILQFQEIFVKKSRAEVNAVLHTDNSQKLKAAGKQQRSSVTGGPTTEPDFESNLSCVS